MKPKGIETCGQCDYYVEVGGLGERQFESHCRRFPPWISPHRFPSVQPTEWCGEFRNSTP